jgi:hypothetical protein
MIDSVDYEIRVPFYFHLRIERRPPGGTISRTMTKLEVILQSPDALAGSFAAKPKVIYLGERAIAESKRRRTLNDGFTH